VEGISESNSSENLFYKCVYKTRSSICSVVEQSLKVNRYKYLRILQGWEMCLST
jgi:hypothetical protein